MHIPEELEFPHRVRLLDWESYPGKSLRAFNLEYLVELKMQNSQLEKLWEATQSFTNLKKMDLSFSKNLKELPDLSNATNLETLDLIFCESLVDIPSSFSHLHKLERLWMNGCINLQVIPANMNLTSLWWVHMNGCSRLINVPLLSYMFISRAAVDLKGLIHLPKSIHKLDLPGSDMEEISDCFKDLHHLYQLDLSGCKRLKSLPELPPSLKFLNASRCESMETVFLPLNAPNGIFDFTNCFKLSKKTRRKMIQNSSLYSYVTFPGKTVPAEFDQQAKGNTLTVVLDGNRSYSDLLFCVVFSPNHKCRYLDHPELLCRPIGQSDLQPISVMPYMASPISAKHLFILLYRFEEIYVSEAKREVMFEFSIKDCYDIIECGAKIWTQENSIEESYESESDQ